MVLDSFKNMVDSDIRRVRKAVSGASFPPKPATESLIEALIMDAEGIASRAEQMQPDNPIVKRFRELVSKARKVTTTKEQRQVLIQIESLEDKVRAIAGKGR